MQPLVSFIFQLICHPPTLDIGSKTRDREGAVALFIGDFH